MNCQVESRSGREQSSSSNYQDRQLATRDVNLRKDASFMVPGVSIAVIYDSGIEWAKGYGVTDTAGLQVVNVDTLFQAASISKPVTAVGIIFLNQSATSDLDRNSNDYLRLWHIPENELTKTEKVTIRRLLSHAGD
jgi:CubicO group peptidase (beta-lactamase class C family)